MLTCLECNATIALDAKACAACGTKIDADGDGVPDALERMVEDKARALIKEEKQRDEDDRARAKRAAAIEEEQRQARKNEQELAALRTEQAVDDEVPRRGWHLTRGWAIVLAICAVLVGGIIVPACVEPMAGRSLAAGSLLCPNVCASCRGPGRVFTWHTTSGRSRSSTSVQLCHNDEIDVDEMNWMDADEAPTQPYRLTMWASVPLDFAIALIVLLLFGPFLIARTRNKLLEHERVAREERIRALSAAVADAKSREPRR